MRVVLAVCIVWLLVALIAGAQTSIGAALTQMPNAPRMPAIVVLRAALISTLPWIPVTLAAIALA
ncbi:MAG TPA: hypothetical protein VFT29_10560, partial [Gemmatimonadaceae bacterium]|nr:hypothetical protein [Gemmatimonadaceae bacterium]